MLKRVTFSSQGHFFYCFKKKDSNRLAPPPMKASIQCLLWVTGIVNCTQFVVSKTSLTKCHSLSADSMKISQLPLTATRFSKQNNSGEDDELLSELKDKVAYKVIFLYANNLGTKNHDDVYYSGMQWRTSPLLPCMVLEQSSLSGYPWL